METMTLRIKEDADEAEYYVFEATTREKLMARVFDVIEQLGLKDIRLLSGLPESFQNASKIEERKSSEQFMSGTQPAADKNVSNKKSRKEEIPRVSRYFWTDEEDALIAEIYADNKHLKMKRIREKIPDRTFSSIKSRISYLRSNDSKKHLVADARYLNRRKKKELSEEEREAQEYVTKFYGDSTKESEVPKQKRGSGSSIRWKEEELAKLERWYFAEETYGGGVSQLKWAKQAIMDELGRTWKAIEQKIWANNRKAGHKTMMKPNEELAKKGWGFLK